jgi:hypothetical protein
VTTPNEEPRDGDVEPAGRQPADQAPEPPPPPPSNYPLEALTALVVGALIAGIGAPLGLLWAHLVPHTKAVIGNGGAFYADSEPEQLMAGEGWYTFGSIALGIAAAVLVWVLLRRFRGPIMLVGLVLGCGVSAWLAWWVGHNVGRAEARRLIAHGSLGQTFDLPVNLRIQHHGVYAHVIPWTSGVLLIMPLVAAMVYVVLAGFSAYPGLRPEWWERPATAPDADSLSYGWVAGPARTAAPGPPAPGEAAPPPD